MTTSRPAGSFYAAVSTGRLASPARAGAVGSLLGIGALHVAWGAGSSWPLPDRAALAEYVVGSARTDVPGAWASYGVAGALGAAGVIVSGRPRRFDSVRRVGVAGVVAVLAGRGVLGLTGRTHLVSPLSTGRRFRELDRRVYAPLCLTLAGLTALSATGRSRPHRRAAS
jgi:hypothetical protein